MEPAASKNLPQNGKLWFAARSSFADGDVGPVRLHHGADYYACSHHSAGLRLAGNGTWLAYVLATIAVLLVALCIARFARYSSSPGFACTPTLP